jgi:hypothetical protein
MAKVVYSSMKPHKLRRKGTSVTTKRVRGPEGRMTTIYQVDANSPTFGDDIGYVFAQNVRRAREPATDAAAEPARCRRLNGPAC